MRISDWSSDVCSSDLIDEIGEGVGALLQLAVVIPLLAQIVAALDMCDRIGKAAIDQAQPPGRKPRRDRYAVSGVSIEEQRSRNVPWEVIGIDDSNRHLVPDARRTRPPQRRVVPGVL